MSLAVKVNLSSVSIQCLYGVFLVLETHGCRKTGVGYKNITGFGSCLANEKEDPSNVVHTEV